MAAQSLETLEIVTASGVRSFQIEMADTDESRAKGLMFRKDLPDGQGMLFDFKADRDVGMWMQNTLISLDMLFITREGRILSIAENTQPLSTRIISAGQPVRAVLELPAGSSRKFGIAPGDRLTHRIFERK